MNSYITGGVIKKLREDNKMTQIELADKLGVSDKTVSKWETGKGYPDISLIESIAKTLNVSIIELFSGETIRNENKTFNMNKSLFYVCPVCGNVICSVGDSVICCHGITLPPLDIELSDNEHIIKVENCEDEYYVTVDHDMSKNHYISFLAAVSDNELSLVKLYSEGNAEARFKRVRTTAVYAYCNRHGLFRIKL